MRKGLLTTILLALSCCLYAQQKQTQGSPHTIVQNKGGLSVDSVLYVPVRGDNAWYGQYGNVRINGTTGVFEYRKSNNWVAVSDLQSSQKSSSKEFEGQPVGMSNTYSLPNTPINGTISVLVNGVVIPNDWVSTSAMDISIIQSFYPIDSTDKVKIIYSYNP